MGTPLNFVSFHAKGAPVYTNDHVRMGIASQLRTIEDGFRIIASYPELKNKPKWTKDLADGKPIKATVDGMMSGDTVTVTDVH